MDDTKKYIKMCEMAIEIQKRHKWKNYDLFWCPEIANQIQEIEKHIKFRFNKQFSLGIFLNKTINCENCGEEISL